MVLAGIITFFLLIVFARNYLSIRAARNAKKNMQCIAFKSDEVFQQVRLVFTAEKLFFTDLLWSPGQEAYNQVGTAPHSPREIWIQKESIEQARQILESRYQIEVTPTAFIVS